MSNLREGHYLAMKRAAEHGILPPGNTREGKACAAVELKIRNHFGDSLNGLQEILLTVSVVPVVLFLVKSPVFNKSGDLLSDYKWAQNKLSKLLKEMTQLAGTEAKPEPIKLSDYIDQLEDKPETESQK
jgi:hypothetical protein